MTVRARVPLLALVLALPLLTACQLVGQGSLRPHAGGEPDVTIDAFLARTGDPWPPPGQVGIVITGDGLTPTDGSLYLVRTKLPCAPSFASDDVAIVGSVLVSDGSLRATLTMPAGLAGRSPQWALVEPGAGGEYAVHRCGVVRWVI